MRRVTFPALSLAAAALLVLWGASWGLSYVELGGWSLPVALTIAAAKAALVVLVFMEIAFEKASIHATLATGLAMIAVLVFFMIADVKTRASPPLLPFAPPAPPAPSYLGGGDTMQTPLKHSSGAQH
jgi:cytochrome c oxidase subunit 4